MKSTEPSADPTVWDALNSRTPVWAPADVLEKVDGHSELREAVSGDSLTIGTLKVHVLGDRHAEVHPHIQGPMNRAYLIDGTVLVTGDEHPVPPAPFKTLVTPINAPWLRTTDLIRYVQQVKPSQVIGVHDGLLNEHGLSVAHHSVQSLLKEGVKEACVPDDGDVVSVA